MDESEKEGYNPDDKGSEHLYCVTKGKGIAKPENWNISGTSPAPGYDHLLVFYMLPQNASRNHSKGEIFKDDPPNGPKCEELYIEFVRNFKFFVKSFQKFSFYSGQEPLQTVVCQRSNNDHHHNNDYNTTANYRHHNPFNGHHINTGSCKDDRKDDDNNGKT